MWQLLCLAIVCASIHSTAGLVKIHVAKIPTTTAASTTLSSLDSTTGTSTLPTTTTLATTTSEKATTTMVTTTEKITSTTKLIPMRNGTNETSASNTTMGGPIPRPPIDRTKLHDYYCKCDVTMDECDINCCCDIDCTSGMMRSFNCIDNLYNQWDYNMEQGLPSCRVSSSLFCVLDERQKSDDEKMMVFDESMKSQILHTWPDIFVEEKSSDDRDYYRYNDAILVFNEETEEIEQFKLPYSLTGHQCQVLNSVKFLKSTTTKCYYNADNVPALIESLQLKKILKIPNYRTKNKNFNSMEHCTGADCDCIEFQFYTCNNTRIDECTEWINTTVSAPISTMDDLYAIEMVTITLRHNYTNLISGRINFYFNYNNNINSLMNNLVLLEYKIAFELVSEAMQKGNSSKKISGNYGYRTGYPIIISAVNNTVIRYFNESSGNTSNDYVKLPKIIKNRLCDMDPRRIEQINFGANRIGKCFVKIRNTYTLNNSSSSSSSNSSNNTNICINIQQLIYTYLLSNFNYAKGNGSSETLHVSKYGNPRNNAKHWLSLKLINNYNLNEISSSNTSSSSSNNELQCSNIQLNVKWKFYYNKLTGNNYQEFVINYVELEHGKRLNLNFNLNDKHFMIPLYYDVIFYEMKFNYEARVLYNLLLIVICMLIIISCN